MAIFENIILTLENYGLFDLFIPFFLVFSIIYALLWKIGLFGENDRIRVLIATIFGFFYVKYFTVVEFSKYYVSGVSYLIVGILSFLLLLALVYPNIGKVRKEQKGRVSWIILLLTVVAVYYAYSNVFPKEEVVGESIGMGNTLSNIITIVLHPSVFPIVIFLLMILFAVWIASPSKKNEREKLKQRIKDFIESFGKLLEEGSEK